MKNILLPTDFSDNAYNAIRYAISLFKNEKCTFYLLNTYIPVIFDTAYLMSMPGMDAMEDVYKETSLKGLAKTKVKIEKEFPENKSKFYLISSFNSLQGGILDAVVEKNIDLVIMGTQGATGAAGVLFGSNTVHVLSNINCPLIAVPSGFTFTGIKEILFPTDFGLKFTDKHLFWPKHLAIQFKAKVNILHVYFYGYELDKEQIKQKEALNDLLDKTKKEFIRMENVDVVKAIEKYQKESPTDLLVLIHNKRSFFDNLFFKPVVKHIGFHLKTPLLVIPSKIK
ncbi:MAG: universal stress protein [Bacteroidetes bacterium HGW-Bacteroidetes-2]|jgi:nucleotide-binding universal stress UspA family protein|nr:MAG: universal stress protein [Bacteroidetes bacterium HGW-Bacteroidetes-2]